MRNNQRRLKHASPAAQQGAAAASPPMGFVSPTEFIELPSKGEFYPEGHPLHKQETIEIRYMTAKDEDILSSQALLKKGLAIDRLIQNLMVLDIDPSTLLLGDRNAMLIAARISGYGSEYKFAATCRGCSEASDQEYDLHSAMITGNCFEQKFLRKNNITYNSETSTLDVVLPTSGVTVGISPVDGHGEKQLTSENQGNEDSVVTTVLSSFIAKVNDSFEFDQVMAFIESMPAKDSKFVRTLYPKLVPNISLKHYYDCKVCFTSHDLEVPLTAAFFWPE
jgi:hypothetical protein